jgi:uncharacterized glyoxalase superfamily protein PhnB
MNFSRIITNICSDRLAESRDFYYEKALAMGLNIVQEPKNEFYGQRRFLTIDPNGCLIDICTPFSEPV